MKDKLEVGMYVRTKKGRISQIKEIKKDTELNFTYYCLDEDMPNYIDYEVEKKIAKSSFNIIDLIEVDDYVNGYLVTDISLDAYKNKIIFVGQRKIEESGYYRSYYNNQIKKVVTKEAFKSMEYRLGDVKN